MSLYPFYSLWLICIQILHLCMLTFKYSVGCWSVYYGSDIQNNYIIYFYIDATQSLGLAQTYFTNLDYMVVQCWVKTIYLSPDTVNSMGFASIIMLHSFWKGGIHVFWHPMWFYQGYNWSLQCCNAILYYCFSGFLNCPHQQLPLCHKCQVLLWHPWTNFICLLFLFRWLCCVNEFVCICMYYFAFLFICVYIYFEFLVSLGILCYLFFILFACSLVIPTPGMLNWSIRWGKSYFCLSHFNPESYQFATFLSLSGSWIIFCGVWVAFYYHVCGYVVTSDVA